MLALSRVTGACKPFFYAGILKNISILLNVRGGLLCCKYALNTHLCVAVGQRSRTRIICMEAYYGGQGFLPAYRGNGGLQPG